MGPATIKVGVDVQIRKAEEKENKMPWNEPEKWVAIPIIGTMLGFFWKGIAKKKDQIDQALDGYVAITYCEMKQKNMSLSLEAVIKDEISTLKDETFKHMRAIELAIQELKK